MLFVLFSVCLSLTVVAVTSDCEAEVQKRILLNDNYDSIIAKLDTLEKEVAMLKSKSAHSHEAVACMAKLTTSVTGKGHHIYFDDVQLNLGNAYNHHHGTFVVPVNGTYQVSITACSAGRHYIVLQVNVNDSALGKVFAGDSANDECNSKVFLGHFNVGDDIFVQHLPTAYGDYLMAIDAYGYPTFSVVLLQSD